MGRYGPHYRTAAGFCSVVRIGRFGRGCADTAHATELPLADMKGEGMGFTTEISGQKYGPGPVLPTGYSCPPYCCRNFEPSPLRGLSSVVWAVSAHPHRIVRYERHYRSRAPHRGARSAKEKPELSGSLFWIMRPLPNDSVFFASLALFRG